MPSAILIADDSDAVRKALRYYLTERNFNVCGEAIDGQDAIEKTRELKPDLILLDLAMPRVNGVVVASVVKDMAPDTRVVLFTMYSEALRRTFGSVDQVDAIVDKAEGMGKVTECLQWLLSSGHLRILVVDDFEMWRGVVSSIVQGHPSWVIVAEASDGLEAVLKATELQPDLVILDIGLPTLNGIEAAKRIGKVAPQSRILFLSQESSPDVIQEALDSGGVGYVCKPRAQTELRPAIESVLAGRQFVSGAQRLRHKAQADQLNFRRIG